MKKLIRKAVCLICLIALAVSCMGIGAIAAEAPEVNATVNLITYADSSQDILDITVYPADTDKWVAISIVDGVDNPVEIYQGKAAPVIEADFSLVDISAGDSLTLRIALSPSKALKDFTQTYYTYAQQQQAIRDIMDPTKEITQEIADKISLKLEGDFNLLNDEGVAFLKAQLSAVYGEMTDIPVADFITSLTDNIKLGVLSCKDAAVIKSFMEREKVSLGISTLTEYSWYSAIKETDKTPLVVSKLADKTYSTLPDFVNAFKAENFLVKFATLHSSASTSFLRENAANQVDSGVPFSLDFATYDALNFVQREYFDTTIATVRYNTLSDLKSAFNANLIIAAQYVEQSGEDDSVDTPPTTDLGTISGGTSSGGGSSSGGGFTPPVVTPVDPPVNPSAGSFKDVDAGHWANEAITALAKDGIINGVDGENFDPSGIVTREQFVKIMVGAFGLTDNGTAVTFGDVPVDQWYTEYINIAVSNGIINGVSESSFGIGMNISRQDMAVIIYRTALKQAVQLPKIREDVPADIDSTADYAKEAVTALYQAGIINGVGGGNFAPADIATRAQAAKIVFELRGIR